MAAAESGRAVKYCYSARIVPIATPVVIPGLKGAWREPVTFTPDHFRIERESRNPAKVCLEHDLLKQIGKVTKLWRQAGWFIADFTLDPELTAVLSVGQPVSVGLSTFESGGTYLSEVSVVRSGAVEGAQITSRRPLLSHELQHELKETPRYVGDDIVIDRADGSQIIYTGREGRAEAIRDGLLVR